MTERHPRTLFVASLAMFAVFLDTTALFVAFPDITASFPEVAPSQLSWVLNGYTIMFAALLIPFGRLADRRGHRRTFLEGAVVFTAASVLCAVAPGPMALVAARVLQAFGAAALVPSSLALVLRSTPRERIPVTLAIWGATGAVAGAVGPTLGAALVETGGWRWVFLVNVPVGALIVAMGRRVLTESRDPDAVVPSAAGPALLVISTVLVTLGIVRGDDWGWGSTRTLAVTAAGLALLGVFVAHQRRTDRPVVDLSLFGARNFAWGNAATFAFGIAFSAMFLSSILFLTSVWHWSVLRAGFGIAPGPLLVAVLAPNMGRLAMRIGQRPLVVTGGLLYASSGLWRLAFLGEHSDYVRDYLPSMLLSGVGVALCVPQLASVVGQTLPPNRLGVGAAVNQAFRQFSGTIGVAVAVALTTGAGGVSDQLVRYDRVWWVLVLGGLATSLIAVPLRTGNRAAVAAWPPPAVPTPAIATPAIPTPAIPID